MAYIYQITNDINGKIYIGKTENSIEKRFQEHCIDSRKKEKGHRPLYAAMRKYGIEYFHIELIEETDNPEEREIFWIEQKGSFKYGYNATIGGDGKRYIDYDQVEALYRELQNCVLVSQYMNISEDSVRDILHRRNIKLKSSQQISFEANKKIIAMCSSDNNIIQIFNSYAEAARYIQANNISSSVNTKGIGVHIRDVCLGRRKSAYGFYWRLI